MANFLVFLLYQYQSWSFPFWVNMKKLCHISTGCLVEAYFIFLFWSCSKFFTIWTLHKNKKKSWCNVTFVDIWHKVEPFNVAFTLRLKVQCFKLANNWKFKWKISRVKEDIPPNFPQRPQLLVIRWLIRLQLPRLWSNCVDQDQSSSSPKSQ